MSEQTPPMRRLLLAVGRLLPAALVSACTVGTPFRGPGLEALGPERPRHLTLVVTHAVLDPHRRGDFDAYIFSVADAMGGDVDGLVGFALRKEPFGHEVWTMSVWRDEASMLAWSTTTAHRDAIAKVGGAIASMESVRVRIAADALPVTWNTALSHLRTTHGLKSS